MDSHPIKTLSYESSDRIYGSSHIKDLHDVVKGLFRIVSDSGASTIIMVVDFSCGSIHVNYDGYTYSENHFGNAEGKGVYHHSNVKGGHGDNLASSRIFLASLGAVSQLRINQSDMTTQRTGKLDSYGSKNCDDIPYADGEPQRMPRNEILVDHLFYNIPVRLRQRNKTLDRGRGSSKSWLDLVQLAIALLLASDKNITLHLIERNSERNQRLSSTTEDHILACIRLNKQAGLIVDDSGLSWRKISFSTINLALTGAISLLPATSQTIQFLSINFEPLFTEDSLGELFQLVNLLFHGSDFGVSAVEKMEGRSPGENTTCKSKGLHQSRNVIKSMRGYPMFNIHIMEGSGTGRDTLLPGERERGEHVAELRNFLAVAIIQWLEQYLFRPRSSKYALQSLLNYGSFPPETSLALALRNNRVELKPPLAHSPSRESDFDTRISNVTKAVKPFSNLGRRGKVGHGSLANAESALITKREKAIIPGAMDYGHPFPKMMPRIEMAYPKGSFNPSRDANCCSSSIKYTSILLQNKIQNTSPSNNAQHRSPNWPQAWQNPVFTPSSPTMNYFRVDRITSLPGKYQRGYPKDLQNSNSPSEQVESCKLGIFHLTRARIIAQLCQRFILVAVNKGDQTRKHILEQSGKNVLLILDQHAADERCEVEKLLQQICDDPQPTFLETPIQFACNATEEDRLVQKRRSLKEWGILYTVDGPKIGQQKDLQRKKLVHVKAVPHLVSEQCKSQPELVVDMLRLETKKARAEHISYMTETKTSWLRRISQCPQGLLTMIISRACRSAIMFGDMLAKDQCVDLVRRLSRCKLPFQCAHGRPSVVPLIAFENSLSRQTVEVGFIGPAIIEEFHKWNRLES